MGSLASHCFDVLKERGVYDNIQKTEEESVKARENFQKALNIDPDVPYFPYPEIIEGSESEDINSDFRYLHGHEPNFPSYTIRFEIDPVVGRECPIFPAYDSF